MIMSQMGDNSGWSLLDRGGRLETLDRDECRRLLEATSIGRLGYCTDFGPRIVPMNYTTIIGPATAFADYDRPSSPPVLKGDIPRGVIFLRNGG
jgi:hypothetical protein